MSDDHTRWKEAVAGMDVAELTALHKKALNAYNMANSARDAASGASKQATAAADELRDLVQFFYEAIRDARR